MSNLPLEVVEMLGNTIAKVVPITIGLALVFSVLTHFWACNPGKPWWRKRELVTDICYWFFVPVFARDVRQHVRAPRSLDSSNALVSRQRIADRRVGNGAADRAAAHRLGVRPRCRQGGIQQSGVTQDMLEHG